MEVRKRFLPTMPPLLLGKTGLDTDEFAALLGVPWEAFSTVKRARRLTVAEQRRFTDLRDRLEHGELAEMKSCARRPILLAEIVGEITRAQPQPPPKQLPLQPPKQPPNPSPGQRAVMLRKFLNIKWATLAEVTGIPVDALRTASARTQLNEASAARLTALADLTVTHPKANEFRAALAELPEPTPVTQPVPAYVPIVRKHGPNSPAATLEEMGPCFRRRGARSDAVDARARGHWRAAAAPCGSPAPPRRLGGRGGGGVDFLPALPDEDSWSAGWPSRGLTLPSQLGLTHPAAASPAVMMLSAALVSALSCQPHLVHRNSAWLLRLSAWVWLHW